MTTSSTMRRKEWIYRFECNIAYKQGDTFLVADINGGGGRSPAIWAQSTTTEHRQTNANMKWEIWSYPLEQSTIVVLWNRHSRRYIMSKGDEQQVEADHGDEFDVKFHWYLEGTDIKNPNDKIPVKFRSVQYPSLFLDLEVNSPVHQTPFVSWKSHNGPTQQFYLHVL